MNTKAFYRIPGAIALVAPMILFAGYASGMDEMDDAGSKTHDCAMASDNDTMSKDCMSKDDGMSTDDDMSKGDGMMMDHSMEHEDSMMQEGGSMMQEKY